MRTRETQSSKDNHQSGKSSRPFFSNDPSHAFFSSQRAQPAPFFQPKGPTSSSGMQAKSATTEGESRNQPVVQRQPAFDSERRDDTAQERSLLNSPTLLSASPIQAKLTIGQPNDKYEQEADRVASQVVEQIHAPTPAQSPQGQSVQRMSEPEEELQAKPEISAMQRMEEPEEELQAKPEISALQRMEEPEEELQAKRDTSALQPSPLPPELQREAIGGGEATADLTSAINSARGGGQPLAPRLQTQMGQAMGADFSGVRVHTDGRSDRLNQSIQAKAFTTGQDVFFRAGVYHPETRRGKELIAHELTHVVQQKGGRVSSPDNSHSIEADGQEGNSATRGGESEQEQQRKEKKDSSGNQGAIVKNRDGTWKGKIMRSKDTETSAMEETIRNPPLRRGNRRGSVMETRYSSLILVKFQREYWHEIKNLFISFLTNRVINVYNPGIFMELINDDSFLKAETSKLFQSGNCGEFANVTFSKIKQNTSGTYVYRCSMVGGDHAFTITYPEYKANVKDMEGSKAMVVDGWLNYVLTTLDKYLKDNYGGRYTAESIKIEEWAAGTNYEKVSPYEVALVKQFLHNAAQFVYNHYFIMLSNQQQWLWNNNPVPPNTGGIHDFTRSEPRQVTDNRKL